MSTALCYQVLDLHFAAAKSATTLLNLNTHLVARELAYILRDAEPLAFFALRSSQPLIAEALALARDRSDDDAGGEPNGSTALAASCSSPHLALAVWLDDSPSSSSAASAGSSLPRHQPHHHLHRIPALRQLSYSEALSEGASLRPSAVAGGVAPQQHLSPSPRAVSPSDPYMLYYTSGTTGSPKGVILNHSVVCAHAAGVARSMRLTSADVWGHVAPMFHLVDAMAVYAVTLVGGRHAFAPTPFEASAALDFLARERVSATNVASTMISLVVSQPTAALQDLASLRVVSCGGSPLPPAIGTRAVALFGTEFFVSYGMTECCGKIAMSLLPPLSAGALAFPAACAELLRQATATSGSPFELLEVRVVRLPKEKEAESEKEELLEDVPKDGATAGEVLIRGPTVFSGYFRRPADTLKAFAPGGWFRTGDLAVVGVDGLLSVVDRAKDMVGRRLLGFLFVHVLLFLFFGRRRLCLTVFFLFSCSPSPFAAPGGRRERLLC